MNHFIQKHKTMFVRIAVATGILLLFIVSFLGWKLYENYDLKKQVKEINTIVGEADSTRDSCKVLLDYDAISKYSSIDINILKSTSEEGSLVSDVDSIVDNLIITRESGYKGIDNLTNYQYLVSECKKKFDISQKPLSLDFCANVIKSRKKDFKDNFIILDGFKEIQSTCRDKYLKVSFSTGNFFQANNNFLSNVELNFSLPFYEDITEPGSEEFLENRIDAKKRLAEIVDISPKVEVNYENIILYPHRAILQLELIPKTQYTLSLGGFETSIGEKTKKEKFEFTTPENRFFGMFLDQKISLFRDTNLPKIRIVEYNSDFSESEIKLCRIDNELYSKIEVLRSTKGLQKEKQEFYKSGIDTVPSYECKTHKIIVKKGEKLEPHFVEVDLGEIIGNPGRSGLYFAIFNNPDHRDFNSRIQEPLFFGVIDSHVIMKTSKNGEAFFFVNDFDGKPLVNQNIRAYVNEFIGKKSEWNRDTRTSSTTYFSPLDTNVFSESILLGKTDSNGILQVDLKDKIDNAFEKTFDGQYLDYEDHYDSIFITSASEANLSYVSSKWNSGIAPWNFGYSIDSWWYGGRSENQDNISLQRWGNAIPKIYSHIYTDRRLYLPGEEVFIKAVVRNSKDLSVPKGSLTLIVKDSKQEEIIRKDLVISEYGSISEKLTLLDDSPLGNYNIYIYEGDIQLGYGSFSVEVFQNPKFKTDIAIKTSGLNNELVKISKQEERQSKWGHVSTYYTGEFSLDADIFSSYYSGPAVKNAEFDYKVYRQRYYDTSYWNDCYYGCYWQPKRELYTEGKGILDENGKSKVSLPIKFESRYNDYKYILEVSVKDATGDRISSTNSIIARLPDEYKRWDPDSGIYFEAQNRFYKAGEVATITGGLENGKFSKEYEGKFLFIIKKKEFTTVEAQDVRGYTRPITTSREQVVEILDVNTKNFNLGSDGRLSLDYTLSEEGEYIFEFGEKSKKIPGDIDALISEFQLSNENTIIQDFSGEVTTKWETVRNLQRLCDTSNKQNKCSFQDIAKSLGCTTGNIDKSCRNTKVLFSQTQSIKVDDLIDSDSRKFFTIIGYGENTASNPVVSDNKIKVLSEKVSYKLGEKARVLVRLPFSGGKILWTIEKQGVVSSEYIDVTGNIFFKEIEVDDTFVPNAYIGVVAVDTRSEVIPEYKVGYTEIVVDKTDKKSDITITTNKKQYYPRETVTLDIAVKDNKNRGKQSELTVMVVDDSLISLMGNIDTNTLEKFYKKLPFQIQTSITNLGMLYNYYFSRPGFVGGSGFGNFKGGDSAVSSRNIFKNTAYYNPSVITDNSGKAKVQFELPDNLTNFRVMVLSQSKDNFFGYSEEMIEVRKDVLIQEKVPLILRDGDEIVLGAQIFNTTEESIGFKASLNIPGITIENKDQNLVIQGNESKQVVWRIENTLEGLEKMHYIMTILGDNVRNSDKIEGSIALKQSPVLIMQNIKTEHISEGTTGDLSLDFPVNTKLDQSYYELSISNSPLSGIEKIITSLARYPYGCIEQTVSSTMPNAVLKRFSNLFGVLDIPTNDVDKNLEAGLKRIESMQLKDGGFGYWRGDSRSNLEITPYVLRTILEIKDTGIQVNPELIEQTVKFLEGNYKLASQETKANILWSLSKYYNGDYPQTVLTKLGIKNLADGFEGVTLSERSLLAHTYALILANPVEYKVMIDINIKNLRDKPFKETSGYYSVLNNKAIFTQMLIDYNYSDKNYVNSLIHELYDVDWDSYYYSTKTKNNSFLAFVKYMENYNSDVSSLLGITLNGVSKDISLSTDKNFFATKLPLSEVMKDGKVSLQIENKQGKSLFVTAEILSYPEDVTKIPAYSKNVTIKREVYEVTDMSQSGINCNWNYSKRSCDQQSGVKRHNENIFKKGTIYKIRLIADFDTDKNHKHVTFEDYIPSTFRILNSKFKINSVAAQQNTSKSWSWNHVENKPEVMMVSASNTWGRDMVYEYFVVPEFEGEFVYPPATVYLMYDPQTRANNEFRVIEVR